jgi:hypothetical protein
MSSPIQITTKTGGVALPPADLIASKQIKAALAALEDARAARSAAFNAHAVLEQQRPDAIRADSNAYADALQAGKDDPGDRHVRDADAKILAAKRKFEATTIVADRAHAALKAAIDAHGEAWDQDAQAAQAKSAARVDKALDELAAALAQHAERVSVARFTSGSGRFHLQSTQTVNMRRTSSSDDYPTSDLVGALRTVTAPPAPPQEMTYTGPVRIMGETAAA